MKLSLFALAAAIGSASAFTVQTPSRVSTALFDSRSRQKVETRTAWLESRGGMATAAEPAAAAGLFTNDEGLEYVKLVHPDTGASSEIYLFGGVVTSYTDADGTEFIAVRPDAKMDGSKPISGGLSHCWPQFGPGEIQQHGFAVRVVCVLSFSQSCVHASCLLLRDLKVVLSLPCRYTHTFTRTFFLLILGLSLVCCTIHSAMSIGMSRRNPTPP